MIIANIGVFHLSTQHTENILRGDEGRYLKSSLAPCQSCANRRLINIWKAFRFHLGKHSQTVSEAKRIPFQTSWVSKSYQVNQWNRVSGTPKSQECQIPSADEDRHTEISFSSITMKQLKNSYFNYMFKTVSKGSKQGGK